MKKNQFLSQQELLEWLGPIDIYLLDQVLKGNLQPGMKLLDAGCGHGRNLIYFLQSGYEVFGIDQDESYVEYVREKADTLAQGYPQDRFKVAPVELLPYPDASFEAVISSAVLHFARNPEHFGAMLKEMWRVLQPEGLLFIRCASDIGLFGAVAQGEGRFLLPDGSHRFLLTEDLVTHWEATLGAKRVEPLKTVNVQGYRCMSTWVLQR